MEKGREAIGGRTSRSTDFEGDEPPEAAAADGQQGGALPRHLLHRPNPVAIRGEVSGGGGRNFK